MTTTATEFIRRARQARANYEVVPTRISNSSAKGHYKGEEVCMPALREGADDALAVPSRVNDRLHYRDGRVTDLQGQPVV